jgi:hypothetical protein
MIYSVLSFFGEFLFLPPHLSPARSAAITCREPLAELFIEPSLCDDNSDERIKEK